MKLLGELLTKKGCVAADEVSKALHIQESVGGLLGLTLIRIGAVSERNLLEVLSEQRDIPLIDNKGELPDKTEIASFIENHDQKVDWYLDQEIVIWNGEGDAICILAKNPFAPHLREAVQYLYPEIPKRYYLSLAQDLDRILGYIKTLSSESKSEFDGEQHFKELAEEAPIVELVNNIMSQAMEQSASDIHFEPQESMLRVRFRIDGFMYTRHSLPIDRFSSIASRIKLISQMDIAERRLPQDGRISIRVGGEEVDVRVSCLPGVHGESIVLRLLPKERNILNVGNLGFLDDHLALMRRWMNEPNGIVLVTGPTGSGKSTTLYASLESINDGERKIITVEDPVEFQLEGITQVQALPEIGLDFAQALRSILRQDPDVIMIGEIRDGETADIAIQSALTGHLVVSTLHTNDSISAFTRLMDMGVEPYLVASPIRGVQAQRLVRRLCSQCARPAAVPLVDLKESFGEFAEQLNQSEVNFHKAVGCTHCHNTGFKGRVGIYEMVEVNDNLQEAIALRKSHNELIAIARLSGYRSLKEDGLLKAAQGQTTIEEVLQVALH